ncbi:hypothetical protein D3C77_230480 [compost metagenome]
MSFNFANSTKACEALVVNAAASAGAGFGPETWLCAASWVLVFISCTSSSRSHTT